MSKYKVGDRVRIVSFMGNAFSPLTGITGRVTDITGYAFIVKLDHTVRLHEPWTNWANDLLLITEDELEYEDNGAGTGLLCNQPDPLPDYDPLDWIE